MGQSFIIVYAIARYTNPETDELILYAQTYLFIYLRFILTNFVMKFVVVLICIWESLGFISGSEPGYSGIFRSFLQSNRKTPVV